IMTLEGMGLVMDPNFSFFEVARPFAKEFMLKREGRFLRDQILKKLLHGENHQIQWGKAWKLAKMAFKMYYESWAGPSPSPSASQKLAVRAPSNV
ncbi:MAG TPA: hypothetical protein VFC61_02240, partial [Blastocatellia bacterium]|nr:hypothetical protein [Blastocatellia bacterium]